MQYTFIINENTEQQLEECQENCKHFYQGMLEQ